MSDSNIDCNDEAWEYYDKLTDALNGLFEILNLALDPNSIYYKCGVDNLNAVKSSLIDVLMKDYDTLELQDTLRRIEFDIKKSLFFENPKKSNQQKKSDKEENF
ncbi:MAG: hypothetical protein ACFFBY_00770 [Promethearchaeota archaeon]